MDLKVNLYKFIDWINNLSMYKLPVIFKNVRKVVTK